VSWLRETFARAPVTTTPRLNLPGAGESDPPVFLLGLDLGQRRDYSALAIAQRTPPWGKGASYLIRHLQRWRLGTPYQRVVDDVRALLNQTPLLGCSRLILDETGVGVPIKELFEQAHLPAPITGVMITGGSEAINAGRSWHVAKSILAGTVEVLLQNGRLKIAPALPEAATLTRELANFEVRISDAGHARFGSWRENEHDDLVLAAALACWAGEQGVGASLQAY